MTVVLGVLIAWAVFIIFVLAFLASADRREDE